MTDKEWIGVDLDGTLAHYERWTAVTHIGDPIWPMVERVKNWLREGKQVKIFTARIAEPNGGGCHTCGCPTFVNEDAVEAIERWCVEHIGQILEVTNVKDRFMVELWDDRAVQVAPNEGEPVTFWTSRV